MRPDHRFLADLTETSTRVEPALAIAEPETFAWDEAADVVVVGVGLAGVCAALSCAEDKGLEIIAIDRGKGGGASRLSGGVVYMGGGTRAQKEAGVDDTPENMANYLAYETGNIVRPDTIRRFAEASVHFQDWLERYGARFGGPATNDKTSYPEAASLYYSGNETTVPGRERATPAQRGHRAKPPKGGEPTKLSGHYLLPPLIDAMERQPNVRFFRQTRATRMVVDASGAVVGIEVMTIPPGLAAWRHGKLMDLTNNMVVSALQLGDKIVGLIGRLEQKHAKMIRIRARKGVVLSAGGFNYNRAMLAKTAPEYLQSFPLGTLADDGSGIKLGMTVGARTEQLDRISAWKFLYAPESWVKSCTVGPDGQRLVGEEYYGARTGEAVFSRAGGKAWMILDQPLFDMVNAEIAAMKGLPLFQKVQYRAIQKQYTTRADTLEELAATIGVPAARLAMTIAEYNGRIERGQPDPLGKSEKYRRKIELGPFFATAIGASLKLAPIPALTMGGLVVDEDTGEVLSDEGGKISGLYAAGRTAVGICSHYYVSGLSLGDCVWSGLRAAETIKGNGGAAALFDQPKL
jgi:3-oxo-5alpha-steroid 4-dehydrogenase